MRLAADVFGERVRLILQGVLRIRMRLNLSAQLRTRCVLPFVGEAKRHVHQNLWAITAHAARPLEQLKGSIEVLISACVTCSRPRSLHGSHI